MKENKIFIFDYQKWEAKLDKLTKDYAGANPYPHIVLDGFLDADVLKKCAEDYDSIAKSSAWINYSHYNERKKGLSKYDQLPYSIQNIIDELNSPEFLRFLSMLTGIHGLQKDDSLEGGGIHQSAKGGFLNIHADFTSHPHKRNWQRRVNVLVYLNNDWQEEWGGCLEIWDRQMINCEKKVLPIFNRCVIFNTDADSYHGHPEPLKCPEGVYRRSIALYYYTEEQKLFRRSTLYKARPQDNGKKVLIGVDNLLVAVYTKIKGWLGANDNFISSFLRIFFRQNK